MPRPSLKEQRSEEILDAFVQCAARYGLEGATQERIAAKAGVQRTILRHYLGNRDEMVEALTRHVIGRYADMLEELDAVLGPDGTAETLICLLFDLEGEQDPSLNLVFMNLVASVKVNPERREVLLGTLSTFLDLISRCLRNSLPKARDEEIAALSQGLAALSANLDSLNPLSPPGEWRAATRRAANLMLNAVKE